MANSTYGSFARKAQQIIDDIDNDSTLSILTERLVSYIEIKLNEMEEIISSEKESSGVIPRTASTLPLLRQYVEALRKPAAENDYQLDIFRTGFTNVRDALNKVDPDLLINEKTVADHSHLIPASLFDAFETLIDMYTEFAEAHCSIDPPLPLIVTSLESAIDSYIKYQTSPVANEFQLIKEFQSNMEFLEEHKKAYVDNRIAEKAFSRPKYER